MAWYWIVLLTVFGVHVLNLAIILFTQNVLNNDIDDLFPVMCFLVWFPLWGIFYPVRAHSKYKRSSGYYQKNGISYWQFMFGKRVKRPPPSNCE